MARSDRREWLENAIRIMKADLQRSADTNLLRLDISADPSITIYLKDETTHPTGSLKHRLARAMFFNALCSGLLHEGSVVVEASSGSTAVSEAFFARLLGLRFIAVIPQSTSAEKVSEIEAQGGECHRVADPAEIYETAQLIAVRNSGWYMDQFTYAERVTDWKCEDSIVASILRQMAREEHAIPHWFVCGAGTGGTASTIGRFLRYRNHPTRLCLADPSSSVFHRIVARSEIKGAYRPSLVEGIGRGRNEPSFIPALIDRAVAVPDAFSIAAARVLSRRLGKLCGGSTGTSIAAAALLASEMIRQGIGGSIATILCDSGKRYESTIFADSWLQQQGMKIASEQKLFEEFLFKGRPVALPFFDSWSSTASSAGTKEVA